MAGMWSKEKAWNWYNARSWLRGCNFMSSDCANRIDQWQELGFEDRLATADRELKLAAETGFNTIRVIPEYSVWEKEHDGFMKRFDRYLATAWKYGISVMVTFGNDCMRPKSMWSEQELNRELGPQVYDWGYHGGRKLSQHQTHDPSDNVGYHLLDDPSLTEKIYDWVREMITTYKNDERVCIWDLYNEPGNSNRGELTMPHLKKFFEIAREIDPIQPLTSGAFRIDPQHFDRLSAVERYCLENSDLISYHNYGSYDQNIQILKILKRYGRPILNTEWLARMTHNTVEQMFPLFYLEKVGCWNWGFVAGLYQTYEPWNGIWQQWANGQARDVDFKVWFHDLYRPSLHPYDPHEIELIQHYCKLADADFLQEQQHKE